VLTLVVLMVTAATGGGISIGDTAVESTPALRLGKVVSVTFVGLMVVGTVLFLAAVILGRGRRPRRTRPTPGHQLMALLTVLVMLVVLISVAPNLLDRLGILGQGLLDSDSSSAATETTPTDGGPVPGVDARWLAVLAVAGGSMVFLASRRRLLAADPEPDADPTFADRGPVRHPPDTAVESELLDVALASVAADTDARRAIIAATYWLEDQLAGRGLPRRPSETPAEYLGRIASNHAATASAAALLEHLVNRAMFSPAAPTLSARDQAVQSVLTIAASLELSEAPSS